MDKLHRDANNDKEVGVGGVSKNTNDPINLENEPNSEKRSSSFSFSSDTSSDEDFILLGADNPATTQNDNGSFHLKGAPVEHNPSALPLHESGLPCPPQPVPGYGLGSENFIADDAKQTPSFQIMVRTDVPDPNRIPSSVFTRTKSTMPVEWSVASNESLFSIHVGKSGELGLFSAHMEYPSMYPLSGPTTPKEVSVGSATKPPLAPVASDVANAASMKNVVKPTADGNGIKDKPADLGIRRSDSSSRLSEGSTRSFRSFAFPILTVEGKEASLRRGESMHQPAQTEQPIELTPAEEPHPPPSTQTEPPKTAPNAAGGSWFSCSFFCSCCCSSRTQ